MVGKRRRFVVLFSVLVIGLVAQTSVVEAQPTMAAAAAEAAKVPVSCADKPDGVAVTDIDRDRFVDLWADRIADQAFVDGFVGQPTVPEAIVAEGFHGLDELAKVWLVTCLVDHALQVAGSAPGAEELARYETGLYLAIFGQADVQAMREDLASTPEADPQQSPPVPGDLTAGALESMVADLGGTRSLTSDDLTTLDLPAPDVSTVTDALSLAPAGLQADIAAHTTVATPVTPTVNIGVGAAVKVSADPGALLTALKSILELPLLQALLKALGNIQKRIGDIQQRLFTAPVVGPLLGGAFWRVCAESATQPLACSVSLPVGVPILTDVNGDSLPDVIAQLTPGVDANALLKDISVKFSVTRLPVTNSGPLPAHVFMVYDPPVVKNRIQFGYDGRASTLSNDTTSTFTLKNAYQAFAGDIHATAQVKHTSPGAVASVTFAVKRLVGGSLFVPPSEADPLTGAVQFAPVPTTFTAAARFIHTATQDQDIFSLTSSTPSTVNAVVHQDTTTTTPKSHREFTALVDKLPTAMTLDLLHQGATQKIRYTGSAPISHVRATDTATGDVTHPGSFTRSVYDVVGVPADVAITLQGAQDINYTASSGVPEATFSTQTKVDDVLHRQIVAQAKQIPSAIHLANTTGADTTDITYDASSVLGSVALNMYDLNQDRSTFDASATSIPAHMHLLQTKSTGLFDFTADAAIGQITASLTRGGGQLLTLPGDHATLLKVGSGVGLDLQLGGLKAAHAEPAQKALYRLTLDPGGQPFQAIADMDDPNIRAELRISAMPADMQVTIDPVTGAAQYAASSVIPDLEGGFTQRTSGTLAKLKMTQLPRNIGATWAITGASPQVTYTADSRLGSIDALYQKAPGGLSFHALISDLPRYMLIQGQDPIVFDARDAAADPPGSSFLGQMLFQYATDGAFESPGTPDDHAYLRTTASSNHAEVLYSGLELLSVNTANQELHVLVQNVSPRLLRAYLTTPTLTATGYIDKVPAEIRIDQVGQKLTYTASDPITRIFTDATRANGDHVTATVDGVPNSIELTFDAANSRINWVANAPTGGIGVVAHLTPGTAGTPGRSADAVLTITSIPATWDASWGGGNVLFRAPTPPAVGTGIGLISAHVTNHGTFTVPGGDHLSVVFDQPSGNLDASLQVSNLTRASFAKVTAADGGGFEADLNMGNHGLLNLNADIDLGATSLTATGSFDQLPSLIHLESKGGRIRYSGDDNPTLTLDVAAGANSALGAVSLPPSIHGVSIRDGASGADKAYRAHLHVTGLPDSLDLNPPAGTYQVGNFHPTTDLLQIDARLVTLAPQTLSLVVGQHVGTASPVSFIFGPFLTSTAGDGTRLSSVNYSATRDMGPFEADVSYGNADAARLTLSEIPGGGFPAPSVNVTTSFGKSAKTVHVGMSHGITEITAGLKHASSPNFDLGAFVRLTDVPKTVDLAIGKQTATVDGKTVTAPDFTFTAHAPTLDIDAFASASLFAGPVDVTAAVSLEVTNLGTEVKGFLEGTKVRVTSTPATGSFLLEAAGTVGLNVNLGFDVGPFVNTGSLTVDVEIKKLTFGFTNATDLGLELGITTGLTGSYDLFTFGLDTQTDVTVDSHFKLSADLPDPFGTITIPLIDINNVTFHLGNVIQDFEIASNRLGKIFKVFGFTILLAHCDVFVEARPHAEFETNGSTIALGPPLYDGHDPAAWLITPDLEVLGLSLPDFAVDVIAFFTSPYGHEIDWDFECDLGP